MESAPLRPIVSTIGAPTYGIVKHLAGLLSHVKKFEAFVEILDSFLYQRYGQIWRIIVYSSSFKRYFGTLKTCLHWRWWIFFNLC